MSAHCPSLVTHLPPPLSPYFRMHGPQNDQVYFADTSPHFFKNTGTLPQNLTATMATPKPKFFSPPPLIIPPTTRNPIFSSPSFKPLRPQLCLRFSILFDPHFWSLIPMSGTALRTTVTLSEGGTGTGFLSYPPLPSILTPRRTPYHYIFPHLPLAALEDYHTRELIIHPLPFSYCPGIPDSPLPPLERQPLH